MGPVDLFCLGCLRRQPVGSLSGRRNSCCPLTAKASTTQRHFAGPSASLVILCHCMLPGCCADAHTGLITLYNHHHHHDKTLGFVDLFFLLNWLGQVRSVSADPGCSLPRLHAGILIASSHIIWTDYVVSSVTSRLCAMRGLVQQQSLLQQQ